MKDKIKGIKRVVILLIVSWGVFSFVLMDFNPINWESSVRFWFIFSPVIYLSFSFGVVIYLAAVDEIKSLNE